MANTAADRTIAPLVGQPSGSAVIDEVLTRPYLGARLQVLITVIRTDDLFAQVMMSIVRSATHTPKAQRMRRLKAYGERTAHVLVAILDVRSNFVLIAVRYAFAVIGVPPDVFDLQVGRLIGRIAGRVIAAAHATGVEL